MVLALLIVSVIFLFAAAITALIGRGESAALGWAGVGFFVLTYLVGAIP